MTIRRSIAPVCLMATALAASAATDLVEFAQYRAVYDLTLEGGDGLAISNLTGRLVIEVTGSSCKGYSSTVRLVTRAEDRRSGEREVTDTRSTTFEAADSRRFDFTNETYTDNELVEESAGTAERGSGTVAVDLTRPSDKTLELDGAIVFPTEQLARTIEAAENGQRFLQLDVYDGAEDGETIYQTATVIGPMSEVADSDEPVFAAAGFEDMPHWPLTISYFDETTGGDATPAYVMSMVLYRNGIGRNLVIDYGDFSLVGQATHLELLTAEPCP